MKVAILALSALALAGCQTTMQQPAKVLYPVEKCGEVQVPEYGVLDRPASDGEVLGGAVIGGVVGNQFGKGDGKAAMTILGAIVGGNVAANQRKQEPVVTGYRTEYRCQTVYE